MAINKVTVDKIAKQALEEISFARTFKQGKVSNWQKNEELYYQKKVKSTDSRANVALGRMQEFVHTLLSKIDNPLVFKFTKKKNSQLKRVEHLNALRKQDSEKDNWDIKDLVGKKQAIIYGRAIYFYYADSIDGKYKAHLEPIDVYDFLIDPSCGGIDIEEARYMGAYSVALDRRQLKEGVKNKIYIKATVEQLLSGSGNAGESSQEETNKRQRRYNQNTIGEKENSDPTKFKFWRWITTYQEDGERYYLLMDNNGNCIRCEKLVDMFPATPEFPLGAFPVWTWAAFPDLTEFWTPSYCDYARELFVAQDVSINQMLDNAEAINKPMRVVNIGAIEDLSKLKYRRDGIIPTKGDYDVNRAVQVIQTPSINTPIQVFNLLELIQEKASGVTAGSKGVSDEDGKVGIYEGNQAATADRFGLLNKSYSFGYKRFSKLYELGVRDNLTKKVAVEILGPQGVEIYEVSRRDIFRKNEEFSVIVEASNAETLASIQDKKAKVAFLSSQSQNKLVNQKTVFEMQAEIVGLTEDQIGELLDTSYYGNAQIMSECDRDIEKLLDDEDIKPNQVANNAYKQRMVDYIRNHEENINAEQFKRLANYIVSIEEIVVRNEARNYQKERMVRMEQMDSMAMGAKPVPQEAVPLDITQENNIM
jgi:hypothetical protein